MKTLYLVFLIRTKNEEYLLARSNEVPHTQDFFSLTCFTNPNNRDQAKCSHNASYQLSKSTQGLFFQLQRLCVSVSTLTSKGTECEVVVPTHFQELLLTSKIGFSSQHLLKTLSVAK